MAKLSLEQSMVSSDTEVVRWLAANEPNMREWLSGKEPQKTLDAYFEERVDYFEPCRKFITRGLSLPAGSTAVTFAHSDESGTTGSEVWEKVFQIIVGRENNDKESGNL